MGVLLEFQAGAQPERRQTRLADRPVDVGINTKIGCDRNLQLALKHQRKILFIAIAGLTPDRPVLLPGLMVETVQAL